MALQHSIAIIGATGIMGSAILFKYTCRALRSKTLEYNNSFIMSDDKEAQERISELLNQAGLNLLKSQ